MNKQLIASLLMLSTISICNVSSAAERHNDRTGSQAKSTQQDKKARHGKKKFIAEKKGHVRLTRLEEKRHANSHANRHRHSNGHRHESRGRHYSSNWHHDQRYIVRHANTHEDYYGRYYGYYDQYGNYRDYDYGYRDRRGRYHAHYHNSHCGHVATPILGAVIAGILISSIFDH